LKKIEAQDEVDERKYLIVATPIRVTQDRCLQCHGSPSDAPGWRIRQFGRTAGFGWTRGQTVAATVVSVPADFPFKQAAAAWVYVAKIVGLLTLACIGFLFWGMRKLVIRPVRHLLNTSQKLRAGDLRASFANGHPAELGDLAYSLQDTTHWLTERIAQEEKLRALFQQFIPASVGAKALGRDPDKVLEGTKHSVTVMVVHIRNFALLMENLSPKDTVKTLNDYFAAVNRTIVGHRGIVSKYMGTTVMAFFGMPVTDENHTLSAIRAALALPAALQDVYVRLDEHYGWELGIGVGISTGEPIVGQFGSSEHYEYSVLGDVVLEAQRLEEISKAAPEEDTILISESTYRPIMSDVHVFDMGERNVQDGTKIHAFAVQGLRAEARTILSGRD
jgi:adenylate cyclase